MGKIADWFFGKDRKQWRKYNKDYKEAKKWQLEQAKKLKRKKT